MIKPIYINGIGCVSIQPTFENDYFFDEIKEYDINPVSALSPVYRDYINPLQLRRMGNSIKMAMYAAMKALEDAGNPEVEAIITGTGEGCLTDTEKFLENILETDEQSVNPTAFIQSTHNMSAAAIALALKCKGYNMTFVNDSTSFETALQDAQLYLNERENPKPVLLGGVDELSPKTIQFWSKLNYLKEDEVQIPFSDKTYTTKGEIISEGSSVFVLDTKGSASAYAKITAVQTFNGEINPVKLINDFINNNNLYINNIDAIVLGKNSDSEFDKIYENMENGIFKNIPQIIYKNIFGEFDTVNSIGLFTACKIIKNNKIPSVLKLNNVEHGKLNRILIYNQRKGKNHSLILLENAVQ